MAFEKRKNILLLKIQLMIFGRADQDTPTVSIDIIGPQHVLICPCANAPKSGNGPVYFAFTFCIYQCKDRL
jgi:hypothetical protein